MHHNPRQPRLQLLIFVQPFWMFSRWILFMKIWDMLCWTIPAPYLRLCSGDDLQVGDSIPFHWQLYNTNSSDEHNHRFHYSKHSQNRELKITHDYAVMLRNNKLNTWWEIWNKQRGNSFKNNNRKETLIRNYNSMVLNLKENIAKIIDGNPYFLYFCIVLWFSKIFHAFSSFTSS